MLIFYVHQNFLLFIKSILVRLPPYNGENIWVKNLKKILKKKISKKISKITLRDTIINNNETIHSLIDFIVKRQLKMLKDILEETNVKKSTKPIFKNALSILKSIEKLSIKNAKLMITKSIESTNALILK